MIISLTLFPPYYVVFVFLCIFFFFVHTFRLYLSASIMFSLPFFLAHTWNLLILHTIEEISLFHEDTISHKIIHLFCGITRAQCHLQSSLPEGSFHDSNISLQMSLAELPTHTLTALHLHGFGMFVSMVPPAVIYPTF